MIIIPNYANNTQLIKTLNALNKLGINSMLHNPQNRTSLGTFEIDSNDPEKVLKIMSKYINKNDLKFPLQ